MVHAKSGTGAANAKLLLSYTVIGALIGLVVLLR